MAPGCRHERARALEARGVEFTENRRAGRRANSGTSFFRMGCPDDASGILEALMDKDRVKGSATNVGGKVKEGAGKVTGDQKLQGEGKLDQAKGKVQKAVGGIKDAIKGKS